MTTEFILRNSNTSKSFEKKKYLRTFESWADSFPDGEAAAPMELSKGEFHVEEGQTAEHEHDAVGDEERS